MKKKILISVIAIIIILTIIVLTIVLKNKQKEFTYTPLLYQICDNDSCIYLLGSIHIGDGRVNKFSDIIINSYKKSDSLVVEVDISDIEINLEDYMLENGTIEDLINSELKEKLIDFSNNHPLFIYDSIKYMKLGYIVDYLSLLAFMENGYNQEGVDSYFINQAKEDNKKIISLETYEQQMGLLLGQSNELYIKEIEDVVDNYEELKNTSNELYNSYINSDLEKLKKLLDEDNNYETKEEEIYSKALFDDRNINMKNKIEEFLANNEKVFMTVGCAHVIGNNGIVDQLKDKYKISIVK